MKVKTHPTSQNLNRAVTLELSLTEAVRLEALLGSLVGGPARLVPWYDQIADALEAKLLPSTISEAVERAGIPRFPADFSRLPVELDSKLRDVAFELDARPV